MDKKYAMTLKGEILNSIGKYEEAIRCYDKALDEKLRHVWYDDWSGAYALTLKGNALSSLGKYEEAIRCYDKALEINKNHPIVVLVNKSGILFPKNVADRWFRSISSLSDLDVGVILDIYEKILENGPDNVYAWTWKGNILSNLARFEEAIRCYDKALEINKNYALAQTNKGNALSSLGKYEEAIRCYDKALEINKNYALAQTNKDILIDRLGKRKKDNV
jgi:tetratricopeptide (TPR) repeat protein